MPRSRVYNERGEQRCTKCGQFFPPDAEHFYLHRGRPNSYCKGCDYARKAVYRKVPTEESLLRRFRAQSLPTSELYQFLAEKHGKEIARKMVDQERQALGLPAMLAEIVYG